MSKPTIKHVVISAEQHRAILRAKIRAQEEGKPFPATISAAVEKAILAYLQEVCPEALETPPQGRPRKSPRKSPSKL